MSTEIVERTEEKIVIVSRKGMPLFLYWIVLAVFLVAMGISIASSYKDALALLMLLGIALLFTLIIGAVDAGRMNLLTIDMAEGKVVLENILFKRSKERPLADLLELRYRYAAKGTWSPAEGLQFVFKDGHKFMLFERRFWVYSAPKAAFQRHRELAAILHVPYVRERLNWLTKIVREEPE